MLNLQSLNNELFKLLSDFDQAIVSGISYDEVRKIRNQIQEVKKQIMQCQLEMLKEGKNMMAICQN